MQFFANLVLVGMLTAQPVEAEALSAALAEIEHQETLIATLEAEYTTDVQARTGPLEDSTKLVSQFHRFHEHRRGRQFRFESERTPDTQAPQARTKFLHTFDGATFNGYDEAGQRGAIFSEGENPVSLFQTLYGTTASGLGELLAQHKDHASAEWLNDGGQRLLAVSWDETGGASRRTLYLDPSAGYQPRRYTLESEYPEGYYPDGRKRGTTTGVIKEFHEENGIFFPTLVEMTNDEVDAKGREFRTFTQVTRVTTLKINPVLDDAVFRIDFPEGTEVQDRDRRVKYIAGRPGSEEPLKQSPPAESKPAMATGGPPYEFWADWRVWAGFSLGCLGLVGFFKWRGLI